MNFEEYKIRSTIIVFFVMIITTLVGSLFVDEYYVGSTFWPAAGFYVAFYYLYKKKVILPILIGITIGNISYRLFATDETFLQVFILCLVFSIGSFVEMILFNYFNTKFQTNMQQLDKLKNGLKFTISSLGAVLVGGSISIVAVILYYGFDGTLIIVTRWITGDFLGVVIFGSLIFFSHYYDVSFRKSLEKDVMKSIIYMISLMICLYYVFGNSGHNFITFGNFQISLVILYIIAAFAFSYRMIIANNIMFLLFLSILYYSNLQDNLSYETVMLSMYIVALSSISFLVRNVLVERRRNYEDLELARNNLEKIIVSTNDLFNVQNSLPGHAEEFSISYLTDMFNLACTIYPKFERASCYIKGPEYVQYVETHGYDKEFLNSLKFNPDKFYWALTKPKIILDTNNAADFMIEGNDLEYKKKYGPIRESIRFSVIIGESTVGGMSFDIIGKETEAFDQYDLDNFASFQTLMNSYYSIGILNTRNNNLKDDLVLSLVRTLELYDSYTGSHSEDVAQLSVEIARGLHLNEEEIRHIFWASIVHDIGKIGISDEILNKAGKLDEMEFEIVKNHTVFGYNILSTSTGLKDIAKTVRHHHEWWNGEGYPDGIRSIEIPYASQIIQVCDSVCAMSTNRVYHKKMNETEIIKQLNDGIGTQFSPKVAKYMIEFIRNGFLKKIFKD